MQTINETASDDLSGTTLFPTLYEAPDWFDRIQTQDDYRVATLSLGGTTQAFMQTTAGDPEDVDTFTMHLDAGDTYRIVFATSQPQNFMSNRAMTVFGTDGSFVDLILNDSGDNFSADGTLTSGIFTAGQSGDYLLFSQLA